MTTYTLEITFNKSEKRLLKAALRFMIEHCKAQKEKKPKKKAKEGSAALGVEDSTVQSVS